MTQIPRKSALVLLNGRPPSKELLFRFWHRVDCRVCADGAAKTLLEYDLAPDIVLGDMDSIDPSAIRAFPGSRILKNPDQNRTDGEKALLFCLESGLESVYVLGALGGRTDHCLYNIGLLRKERFAALRLRLLSDSEEILLVRRHIELHEKIGTGISLMPVFGPVQGVSTRGLLYPLADDLLELGGLSSISNRFSQPSAVIDFPAGELLVLIDRSERRDWRGTPIGSRRGTRGDERLSTSRSSPRPAFCSDRNSPS